MTDIWTPNPCDDDAGWTGLTVCTRPYGRGSYDRGPYGRCAIVGGAVWGEEASCAPFAAQAPAPVKPWRRNARGR